MPVSNILRTFVPILTHPHNFIIKALDDSVVFLYLFNICLFPQVNWGLNKDKERAVCVCAWVTLTDSCFIQSFLFVLKVPDLQAFLHLLPPSLPALIHSCHVHRRSAAIRNLDSVEPV